MGCGDGYVLAVAQNVSLTSSSPQMFSDLQDQITFAQSLEQVNPDKFVVCLACLIAACRTSSYLGDELFWPILLGPYMRIREEECRHRFDVKFPLSLFANRSP